MSKFFARAALSVGLSLAAGGAARAQTMAPANSMSANTMSANTMKSAGDTMKPATTPMKPAANSMSSGAMSAQPAQPQDSDGMTHSTNGM